MKTFDIKITGEGTLDQLATRLIAIGKGLQIANVYPDQDEVLTWSVAVNSRGYDPRPNVD